MEGNPPDVTDALLASVESSGPDDSQDPLWQMMVVQFTEDGDSALTVIQGESSGDAMNIRTEEVDVILDGVHHIPHESDIDDDDDDGDDFNDDAEDDDDEMLSPGFDLSSAEGTPQRNKFSVHPVSSEDLSFMECKVQPLTISDIKAALGNASSKQMDVIPETPYVPDEDHGKSSSSSDSNRSTPKSPNVFSSDESYFDTSSSTTSSVPLLHKTMNLLTVDPAPTKALKVLFTTSICDYKHTAL